MEKKSAHLTSFKNSSYKKWRHNSLVDPVLYKKCWKKHSLVFIDRPPTSVIGIAYVQHSTKFPEYGEHGFHLLKLSTNRDLSEYIDSIVRYMHFCYNNPTNIMWFPVYIWWYKKDDESGVLHNVYPHDTDGSNHILYDLIDLGDIYVVKMTRNYREKQMIADLRGKELLKYLTRNEK